MNVKECIDAFDKLIDSVIEVKDKISIFNIIECDLATEYVPLYAEESWSSRTHVNYDEFQHTVLRIVSCSSSTYKTTRSSVLSIEPLGTIRYAYTPKYKHELQDTSDYSSKYLKSIVYGMCAEYYCRIGEYDLAYEWSHRYKQEIRRNSVSNKLRHYIDLPEGIYYCWETDTYWKNLGKSDITDGLYKWQPVRPFLNTFIKDRRKRRGGMMERDGYGFVLVKLL